MKASVLLAHPNPKSFNHAIYHQICSTVETLGMELFKHDLYLEKFNPVLTGNELGSNSSDDHLVNLYASELVMSDYLFFIHPNWWGQPPAIMKGYIDRVIRPPYAYDFTENESGGGLPIEKLKGKYGVVYNTSNTEADRENNYFGDPLENIWKQCVFGFCGIDKYHRRMFRSIEGSSDKTRTEWLAQVNNEVKEIFNSRIEN